MLTTNTNCPVLAPLVMELCAARPEWRAALLSAKAEITAAGKVSDRARGRAGRLCAAVEAWMATPDMAAYEPRAIVDGLARQRQAHMRSAHEAAARVRRLHPATGSEGYLHGSLARSAADVARAIAAVRDNRADWLDALEFVRAIIGGAA